MPASVVATRIRGSDSGTLSTQRLVLRDRRWSRHQNRRARRLTMKALVYYGPNDLKVADMADPKPAAGEALLRVKSVGICGSDVHGYLGLTGRRLPPMVMGHEFAAEVVELGKGATGVKVGDRVATYPVVFCDDCTQCRQGNRHMCLNKRAFGVLDCNGAMAEYICAPAKILFKLADPVSYDIGSLMEPLAVAARAVNHAGDLAGKTVMVVGAGTIGLLIAAVVKTRGAAKIIVSDLAESRLEVAKKMGADRTINGAAENLTETIRAETGGGVDVTLEAVGATPTVQQAMSCLKLGGTAVWVGNSAKMVNMNMQEVVTRELKVVGSFLYSYDEFAACADLLNAGKLDLEHLISLRVPMFEKGPEMFAKLAKDPGPLIKVILN
jgi:L-iditol 2-dehydrogenase